MPDFQFSEEHPTPAASPPTAPPTTAPEASENPPPAPAPPAPGFQFSLSDTPAAPTAPPKAPAPIPGPPIPAGLIPPSPIPGPPIPKLPTPTAPQAPVAPKVPTPAAAVPGVPVAPAAAPKAPVPGVPNPQIPFAPRPANAPTNTPTATAPAQNPAPRAAPVPIAIPTPNAARLDVIEDRVDENAPQDAFSRRIWDVGQKIKAVLDALEGPASWVLRVAVVIGICALAYILAATLFGGAGHPTNPKMAMLTKNLDLASRAFVFSLLGAAIASLLLGYEDNRLGAIVCGLGVLFHFGMPIALKKFVGDTPAVSVMATHFRHGGYYLVMIGLVKAVCDTAIWLWNLPDRMKTRHANVGVSNQAEAKQRIIARESNMFSPCWKLPFCRESIRKQCPAFLAKTTCWKFGRGCYCDTEMISRIVRGESLELIKAPTQQSRQGRPPCGRCYIYLEHQTYKFRVLSPLALPVAVLSTWLIWPLYTKVFALGNNVFNSIWSSLSFNSANLTSGDMKSSTEGIAKVAQQGASAQDIAHIAQNMFGVLMGFMLLIYLSKFIEWAIYKAKW